MTKLSELAQSMEKLDSGEEMEKGNKNMGKKPIESPRSTSQRSSRKRFKDPQGEENYAPARFPGYSQEHKSGFRPSSGSHSTSVTSTAGSARAPLCEYCDKCHFGKCRKLTGGCFGFGATDHYVQDCPKNNDAIVTPKSEFTP